VRIERRRAALSGGELSYLDGGEGPAVVLLHGFPSSAYLWRRELPLLGSRMRVVAPDLLGYGESEKPPEADLTVRAQAGYVGELLDVLGIGAAAFVGHDLGGGVAQLLALEGRAAAIVLLDTVCFDAWPIEGVKMLQATSPEQETAGFADRVVRLTFDLGMEHEGRLSEDDLRAYLDPWTADPAALFRAARAIDGVGLAGRDADVAALDLPALVLWGEEDPFLPPALAERLGDLLPGATVALLPGCGHFVNEDAPTTVGPLIYEYLRSAYLHETHGHAAEGPVPVFLERPPAGFRDDEP